MKKPLFLVAVISLSLLSCSGTPAITSTEQAVDVIPTPGGYAYRANVHQQGVPDKWPPIAMTTTTLGTEPDAAQIMYRDSIETKAGQTRNNIFYVYLPSVSPDSPDAQNSMNLDIRTVSPPAGFSVSQDGQWSGSAPGMRSELVLKIQLSAQEESGSYDLELDVNIDGKDYGNLPCTIKVVKQWRAE